MIKRKRNTLYPKINHINKIKLKKLYDKIYSFEKKRNELDVDVVKTKLDKKLYSTYLTYLPKKKFLLKYKKNIDKRGNFSELVKSKYIGQISYFSINPSYTRGNHFHFTKVEKFFPIYGQGKIVYKNILDNQKLTYKFNYKSPMVYEAIPGWSHKFVNSSKSVAIFLVWANEIFDKKKPDTYYHKI